MTQHRTNRAQPRRLVIVESPTKARTISRFLPSDFQVEASMGHVRDLPASAAEIPKELKGEAWARLGVKVDDNFAPVYVVSPKKRSVVSKLKSALKNADELYIATDEDREGESIGWHLVEVLEPNVPVKRMVFHEITEDAILRALDETREIDRNLVDAQETRRILDRLVGYTISPLLWRKIAPRLSAGRVQSVAVRLLVLREQERIVFLPGGYWDLKATLAKSGSKTGAKTGAKTGSGSAFDATMTHLDGVRLASGRDFNDQTGKLNDGLVEGRDVLLMNEATARDLAQKADARPWSVDDVEEREASRGPSAPFTTSTLQQEASRKLNLAAKETMRVAQGLYEKGYITYMRTDSTHLAQEAIDGSRRAIRSRYGEEYLSPAPRQFTTKSRNAQEAHEAIRPAGKAMHTREDLKLGSVEGSLYDLIWKRTVATQMADARLKFVTVRVAVEVDERLALFRASGRTTIFPGFFRAYVEGSDDPEAALDDREQPLPPLEKGDALDCHEVEPVGHETKPPARYTEASLVKLLESEGIGRPSTYASIMDTIQARGYARKKGSQLIPTFTAFATNNLLEKQFGQLVDTEFTANMEAALDDIAAGSLDSTPYLRRFFLGEDGIESRVEDGLEEIDARQISTIAPAQWAPFVIRVGRFGPYVEGEIDGELKTASMSEEVAPADVTRDLLQHLVEEGNAGDKVVGHDTETGRPMLLKRGPYGPYIQLGEDEGNGKPKRVSLPPGLEPNQVDETVAAGLLSLPRRLGEHPTSGEPVEANIGRYGPYVKHRRTFASLPKDENVLTVRLARALELIAAKESRNQALKVLGDHPETGDPIELRDGRYGPYVKHGKTNASLQSGQDPDTITLEEALALLAAREAALGAKGGGKAKGARKTKTTKTKATKAKAGAKKSAKRKAKTTKTETKTTKSRPATKDQLAGYLDKLDAPVAEVVKRLEGIGRREQPLPEVANALGLSQTEVETLHKRGMFKLRMAYGQARKAEERT